MKSNDGFDWRPWKWPGMAWSLCRALCGGYDAALIADRLKICRSCEHVKTDEHWDDAVQRAVKSMRCGQCKCGGVLAISELHTKLGFKALRCPLDPPRWGEAHGLNPQVASATLRAADQRAKDLADPVGAAERQKKMAERRENREAERAALASGAPFNYLAERQLGEQEAAALAAARAEVYPKVIRGEPTSVPADQFSRLFQSAR